MSRRFLAHPLLPVVLFSALLGGLLRLIVFVAFPHPGYPDAEYYVSVARELATGHGFTVPYLWSFAETSGAIPAVASLPIPAFGHWMPLASIIQVPFIWLLGPTDLASALPFLVLGSLLGPLTAVIASQLGLSRPAVWTAALWAASAGGAAVYLGQPDNYALFALLAGSAFLVAGRVRAGMMRRPLAGAALAGLLAGLSYLSRGDGFLVAGAVVLALVPWGGLRRQLRGWTPALAAATAALLMVAPWLLRQASTFGTLSPSAASGRILFIRDYQEIYGSSGPLGPDYLFSWGLGNLLGSRLAAAGTAILLLGLLCLAVVLVPLVLAGLRRHFRAPLLAAALIWMAVYLGWAVVVAAPHLAAGNFVHSAVAIIPLAAVLAAGGAELLWAKFRRLHAILPGLTALVGLVLLLSVGLSTSSSALPTWAALRASESQAAAFIVSRGGGRVESGDPGAYWLLGGLNGTRTPYTDDLTAIIDAAQAYGERWLVVDGLRDIPALKALQTSAPPSEDALRLAATFGGPGVSSSIWVYELTR